MNQEKTIKDAIRETIAKNTKFANLKFFCKNDKREFVASDLLSAEDKTESILFPDGRWSVRCPSCGMEIGIFEPDNGLNTTAK